MWFSYSVCAIGSAVILRGQFAESFQFNLDETQSASSLVSADVSFPYIFAEPNHVDASEPVIDHLTSDTISAFNEDRPAFLYDGHQPDRIVLFYGDWCDTMKEFKPRFINWAKELQAQAEANGGFVMVFAVSCRPNQQLCLDQGVHGFPVVRVLKKDEVSPGFDLSYKDLTLSNVFEKLGFGFSISHDENAWTMAADEIEDSPTEARHLPHVSMNFFRQDTLSVPVMQRRRSLADDIHLSLDFALRHTLFSEKKPLNKSRKRHFIAFMKLMARTFPPKWELQELLSNLLKDSDYVTDSPSYLSLTLDRHPPKQHTWSLSCSKGKKDAGFACGMWKLLHTVSVGLVRYNAEANEDRRIATKDAATTIKMFLSDFEQCVDCRDNFQQSYDRCDYGRCHLLSDAKKGSAANLIGPWAQLSLWLVEWHNGVNTQVLQRKALAAGRNVTRSEELAVLWPPRSECLPCWEKAKGNALPKLNPTMTFNWLKAEYGPNDPEVRKAEQYIKSLHRKEARNENRPKLKVQILQSSVVVLILAVAWKGSTRKRTQAALSKKDDTAC